MLHHTACAPACHGRVSEPAFQAGDSLSPFELVDPSQGSARTPAEACDAGAARAGGGLVPFSTSGQGGSADFPKLEVDRLQSRLNRMSSGVLTATRLIDAEWAASKIRFHRYMLTLTYRPGALWSSLHISNCLKNIGIGLISSVLSFLTFGLRRFKRLVISEVLFWVNVSIIIYCSGFPFALFHLWPINKVGGLMGCQIGFVLIVRLGI